jgi:hypothetical protein
MHRKNPECNGSEMIGRTVEKVGKLNIIGLIAQFHKIDIFVLNNWNSFNSNIVNSSITLIGFLFCFVWIGLQFCDIETVLGKPCCIYTLHNTMYTEEFLVV